MSKMSWGNVFKAPPPKPVQPARMIPGNKGDKGAVAYISSFSKGAGKVTWMVPNPQHPSNQPKQAAAAPAPSAAAPQPPPTYNPTPLTIGSNSPQNQSSLKFEFPEMPPQKFAPGGIAATVDSNAAGFRRKKSSARMAGLTSKGTGQFKITGQSGKSSGLNIGV